MQDAQMAKSFQMTEDSAYRQEESLRREQLRLQYVISYTVATSLMCVCFREEKDREEAEKYVRSLEQQVRQMFVQCNHYTETLTLCNVVYNTVELHNYLFHI